MQFVDKAKIAIKAGDGGDGCASFHLSLIHISEPTRH